MNTIAIIPARYASTRLPGKPLLADTGKPLIQHVVESVLQTQSLNRVVVATDDERIQSAVKAFGCKVIMTRCKHTCGTDRIAEAAEKLKLADDDIVVNVQGDEPEIPPACIEKLVELIKTSPAPMATLATPLATEFVSDTNKVKVVCDLDGFALYFSRSVIPHDRDGSSAGKYLLHLGIYAYRAGFLKTFSALPCTPAEKSEKLEQLRALEHGHRIAVAVVEYHGQGIDTPEDYAAFVKRFKASQ